MALREFKDSNVRSLLDDEVGKNSESHQDSSRAKMDQSCHRWKYKKYIQIGLLKDLRYKAEV